MHGRVALILLFSSLSYHTFLQCSCMTELTKSKFFKKIFSCPAKMLDSLAREVYTKGGVGASARTKRFCIGP